MIKYALKCPDAHRFEGWFSSIADYDRQAEAGELECPVCGDADVTKDVMAPAIATRGGGAARGANGDARAREVRAAMNDAAHRARKFVEANFTDVGKRFPEEARKIHYGETEAKAIYGHATREEVRELRDEGVEIAPVPRALDDKGDGKAKLN